MRQVLGVGRRLRVLAGLALFAAAIFATSALAQWGAPAASSGTPSCKSVMMDELAIYKASLDAAPSPTGRARTAQQFSSNDTYMTLAARAQQVQTNNGPTAPAECNNVRTAIAAARATLPVEIYDCADNVQFDLDPNATPIKGGPRTPFVHASNIVHVTVRFSSAAVPHMYTTQGTVHGEENDMQCYYRTAEGIELIYWAKSPPGRTCKVSTSKPSRFECTR